MTAEYSTEQCRKEFIDELVVISGVSKMYASYAWFSKTLHKSAGISGENLARYYFDIHKNELVDSNPSSNLVLQES